MIKTENRTRDLWISNSIFHWPFDRKVSTLADYALISTDSTVIITHLSTFPVIVKYYYYPLRPINPQFAPWWPRNFHRSYCATFIMLEYKNLILSDYLKNMFGPQTKIRYKKQICFELLVIYATFLITIWYLDDDVNITNLQLLKFNSCSIIQPK